MIFFFIIHAYITHIITLKWRIRLPKTTWLRAAVACGVIKTMAVRRVDFSLNGFRKNDAKTYTHIYAKYIYRVSWDLCTETGGHINRIVHIFRRGVIFCPIPIGFLRVFIIIILFTVSGTALFFWSKNNSAPLEWFKTLGSTKIQNKIIYIYLFIYYAHDIEIHIRHPVDCPHAQQQLMTMVFFVYCPVLSIRYDIIIIIYVWV